MASLDEFMAAKHLARVQAVWGLLKEVGQREAGVLVPMSARGSR